MGGGNISVRSSVAVEEAASGRTRLSPSFQTDTDILHLHEPHTEGTSRERSHPSQRGRNKASIFSANDEGVGLDQWFPNHSPRKVSREDRVAWVKIKV